MKAISENIYRTVYKIRFRIFSKNVFNSYRFRPRNFIFFSEPVMDTMRK